MRRALKIALLLLLLAAGAIAAFLLSVDINRFKPELVALVERQTGRSFAIGGSIRFAPSLVPTVVLEGVRLGNAEWGRGADLAVIERAEAQVALIPLLHRRIEVKRIVIVGAVVNLETDAQSIGNWVLHPTATAPRDVPAATAPIHVPELAVETIRLENSTLQFRSGTSGRIHTLALAAFAAKAPDPLAPVAVTLRGAYLQRPVSVQGTVGPWKALAANASWPVDLSGNFDEATFTAKGHIERPLGTQAPLLAVTLQAATLADFGRLAGITLPPLLPASLAATLATEEERYVLRDLRIQAGRSDLAGHLAILPRTPRPMIEGDVSAGLVDLTEVLPPLLRHGGRLISAEPLFMETLPPGDARLGLRATELRTHKAAVANLSADVTLTERNLQIHLRNASVAGGEVEGIITVAPAPQAPRVDIDLRARGILPAQLPQFRGKQISGAPTDLDISVAGAGRSIAAVMGSGNGRILVRVGPGRMPNNLASADLLFDTVRLLNPLSRHDPHTAIECVVLNFGVHDGIASTRNGVAVRTDKLTVLGGGVVNLKNERLDIGVQPKPREGTGLNVAALGGDLVRIGGTLSKPVPVADAEAVAVAGVKLGAAVATGGLSLLAEGLYDRATAEEDVCAIALRGAPRSAAKGTTTAESGTSSTPAAHHSAIDKASETTKKAVKSTGEAVQGAFRKLFGR